MRASLLFLVLAGCSTAPDPVDGHDPGEWQQRGHSKKDVVVVDSQGEGVPNELVAVHSATGELLQTWRTGLDGSVRVQFAPGGSVTHYLPFADFYMVVETVYDVDQGPVRFLGGSFFGAPPPGPDPTLFEITVVGAPADAFGFFAATRCNSIFSDTATFILDNAACSAEDDDSVYISAVDADFQELSWGWVEHVAVDPGNTVQVQVDASHVERALHTVSVADVPLDQVISSSGQFDAYFVGARDRFGPGFVGGTPVEPTNQGTEWTFSLPDADFPMWSAGFAIFYANGAVSGITTTAESGDVAFSVAGLPSLDVTRLDVSAPEGPALSWEARGPVEADMAVAQTSWTLADGRTLFFVGNAPPAGSRTLTVPAFPAEVADWSPDTAEPQNASVDLRRSTLVDDWSDVAADPWRGFGVTRHPATRMTASSVSPLLEPPSVGLFTPTSRLDWSIAAEGTVDLAVTGFGFDNQGPATVTWSNDLTGQSGTMAEALPFEATIAIAPGTNVLTFTATDTDGLQGSTTLTVHNSAAQVWSWGQNNYGELGTGSQDWTTFPFPIESLSGVVAVAAGSGIFDEQHVLALLDDGTVMAWGGNSHGQLGDGTTTSSWGPVAVSGLTGVVGIAAGHGHSLAVLDDGTVRAWGANVAGELGDGTGLDSAVPVEVVGLTNAVAVAAGDQWSMALLADGTIQAWGNNLSGNFGNGTFWGIAFTPVPGPDLDNVVAISAGYFHALALLDDGTVRSWGFNARGQLGNGDWSDSAVPVDPGLTGVRSISGGMWHSLAVLDDGTVRAWGANDQGQLGNNGWEDSPYPVVVLGLWPCEAVSAGVVHSAAVRSDGTVLVWGDDGVYPFWTPNPIMSGPTTVSAGGYYTIALAP